MSKPESELGYEAGDHYGQLNGFSQEPSELGTEPAQDLTHQLERTLFTYHKFPTITGSLQVLESPQIGSLRHAQTQGNKDKNTLALKEEQGQDFEVALGVQSSH